MARKIHKMLKTHQNQGTKDFLPILRSHEILTHKSRDNNLRWFSFPTHWQIFEAPSIETHLSSNSQLSNTDHLFIPVTLLTKLFSDLFCLFLVYVFGALVLHSNNTIQIIRTFFTHDLQHSIFMVDVGRSQKPSIFGQ